jgi:hypothetical protein
MAFREVTGIQLDQPGQTAQRRKTLFREVDPTQIQFDEGVDAALLTQAQPQAQVQPQESLGIGDVASQAIENLPGSAGQFARDIIQPFVPVFVQEVMGIENPTGPIATAKSLGGLAKGLFNKLTPGVQPSEASVDALTDFFSERYGGIDNIKQTIATDPVGFASDLSVILTGGAAAATKIGTVGKVAGTAGKAATQVGKVLKTAGRVVEPINLARAPLRTIAKLAPQSVAEKLIESGVKFSTKIKPAQRSKIIQAALDEKITPTKAGLRKSEKLVAKYANQVDDIIDRGIRAGKGGKVSIKTDDVLTRLDDVRDTFEASAFGSDFANEITELSTKFKKQFGDTLTPSQAQEIKRNTQQILRKSFGQLSNVRSEAGKAIARGLREELEIAFPEVAKLNKKSSELIQLNKSLESAVARLSNRDVFGLGSKVLATGGTGANLLAAMLEQVAGQASVKAKLAIAINKVRKKPIAGKEIPTLIRQLALQAGREARLEPKEQPQQSLEELFGNGGQQISEPSKPTFQPRLSQGLRKINGTQFGR